MSTEPEDVAAVEEDTCPFCGAGPLSKIRFPWTFQCRTSVSGFIAPNRYLRSFICYEAEIAALKKRIEWDQKLREQYPELVEGKPVSKKDLLEEYQPSKPQVRFGACPYRLPGMHTVGLCRCLKQDCLAFEINNDRPFCNAFMIDLDDQP